MTSRVEEYYAQRLRAREWVQQLKRDPAKATGLPWSLWRLEDLHAVMQARIKLPRVNRWALAMILTEEGFSKAVHGDGIRIQAGQYRLWLIGNVPASALVDGGAAGRYYDEERASD